MKLLNTKEESKRLAFFSPQILPLPAGLLMIVAGLAGGFQSQYVTIYVSGLNGFVLAGIGAVLTFYSLWIYRSQLGFERKRSQEISDLKNLADEEKSQIDLLKLRNSLSENQEDIIEILESKKVIMTFSSIKLDLEDRLTFRRAAPIADKELSLRLDKLVLQGFLEKSSGDDGMVLYSLSEKYEPLVFKPDVTTIIS